MKRGDEPAFLSGASKPVRKAIRLSQETLIKSSYPSPGQHLPLIIEPNMNDLNLVTWAVADRESIIAQLSKYGALLFRNFKVDSASQFEKFIEATSSGPLEYVERSSPRSTVSGNIYTSTDYPADKAIFLHNEQSYNLAFPGKIYFYCVTPAQAGGRTPIADTRRIFQQIDPVIRDRFIENGYMYVRNFGDGFGLSWQDAFQVKDKHAVEEYCRNNEISVEWKEGNRLRTRQLRRVVANHPVTGETVWFNHATFFHISTIEPVVRETMLTELGEDGLPNNTCYGNGLPIERDVMEHLQSVYQLEKVSFQWQAGDILMLDNLLTSHGREPFEGPRRVLVGMADIISWDDV